MGVVSQKAFSVPNPSSPLLPAFPDLSPWGLHCPVHSCPSPGEGDNVLLLPAITVASRGPPQGTAICMPHVQDVFPVMFPVKKKQQPNKLSHLVQHHPSCRLICSNLGNNQLYICLRSLKSAPLGTCFAIQSLITGSQTRFFPRHPWPS